MIRIYYIKASFSSVSVVRTDRTRHRTGITSHDPFHFSFYLNFNMMTIFYLLTYIHCNNIHTEE